MDISEEPDPEFSDRLCPEPISRSYSSIVVFSGRSDLINYEGDAARGIVLNVKQKPLF